MTCSHYDFCWYCEDWAFLGSVISDPLLLEMFYAVGKYDKLILNISITYYPFGHLFHPMQMGSEAAADGRALRPDMQPNPACVHETGCHYTLSFLSLPFNLLSLVSHQNQSFSNYLVRFQCSLPKFYYPALRVTACNYLFKFLLLPLWWNWVKESLSGSLRELCNEKQLQEGE